ncbi:hypothetical protein F5888DRAFT_1175534 [Russula emetica]|nr:hypothetical protein F5888DRAFT_1175534 [Russula emetica]
MKAAVASPQVPISSAQLKNVKAQLLKPKTANKVIAQLKALPAFSNSASHASEPIQAVCLPYSDEEADAKRFGTLRNVKPPPTTTTHTHSTSPKEKAPIDAITDAFKNLHIVSLFTAPDLGLGESGDGEGILAGALPSAETVLNGFTQITPQLMALGYTAGKSFAPNHKGIYPPTDRLSILTYWWGLEILLPPPTLAYLSRVKSISGTILNVLTGLGVMYEGVREILPFVRYFSQYINFEFSTIKVQDRGKGVICAATWIMPAALVPRPWDFPDPPSGLQLHTQVPPPLAKAPATVPVPTSPSQAAPPPPPVSQPSSSGLAPLPLASPSPATLNAAPSGP